MQSLRSSILEFWYYSDKMSQAYVGYQDGSIISFTKDTGLLTFGCGSPQTGYNLTRYAPMDETNIGYPYESLKSIRVVPGYNATKRPWYIAAVEKGDVTWGKVYSSFTAAGTVMAITAVRPIFNQTRSSIIGVSGVEMNLNVIQGILQQIYVSSNGKAYIVQKDGGMIANTFGTEVANQNGIIHYSATGVDLIEKSGNKLKKDSQGHIIGLVDTHSFSITENGEEYFVSASTIIDPRGGLEWTVVVLIPRKDIFSSVDRMLIITSALTAALFVVILASTLFASAYISRPLNIVASAMQSIARLEFQDEKVADSTSGLREIRDILSSFQVMDTALQSFVKYVPMNVVKRIVGDSNFAKDLYVERKRLTIMFSDIKNFTQLAETLPVDTLLLILAEYLEEMTKLISSTEGLICDFIGDGIMAIWNAPVSITNHEHAAVQTAILQQKALQTLNQDWISRGFIHEPLCARIGIHSGDVLVGNIGSRSRMKYGAVGDAVNLASRLEGLNKKYGTQIIISDATYQAVGAEFFCRSLEKVVVKGRIQKVEVFEVLESKPPILCEFPETQLVAKCKALDNLRHWDTMESAERSHQLANLRKHITIAPDEPATVVFSAKSHPSYLGYTVFDEK
eukprot:TRINITY_DN9093_c0_g1_i1.p1 TRINITY_DN9093_c0_g1~~TRINITY_DN9093_c0_g1_i1.p1  ORF type:complete len:624 (+),score=121.78 TRINITY_DN9093_c0_g1_i1:409-2280(+)